MRIFRKGCNDREAWKHQVLVTERKQIIEFQTFINTSSFDDKCERMKVWVQQYCFKNFASQKHLNCINKAKFVHTKQNHQSWHPNRCACFLRKNFALFLEETEVVWLRSVSFEIDNFEISWPLILVKSFVSSWIKKRRLGLQVIFLLLTSYDSRKKRPFESRIPTFTFVRTWATVPWNKHLFSEKTKHFPLFTKHVV